MCCEYVHVYTCICIHMYVEHFRERWLLSICVHIYSWAGYAHTMHVSTHMYEHVLTIPEIVYMPIRNREMHVCICTYMHMYVYMLWW